MIFWGKFLWFMLGLMCGGTLGVFLLGLFVAGKERNSEKK